MGNLLWQRYLVGTLRGFRVGSGERKGQKSYASLSVFLGNLVLFLWAQCVLAHGDFYKHSIVPALLSCLSFCLLQGPVALSGGDHKHCLSCIFKSGRGLPIEKEPQSKEPGMWSSWFTWSISLQGIISLLKSLFIFNIGEEEVEV